MLTSIPPEGNSVFFSALTDSDISDFIHNLESQNIKVEMMKQSDYMAAAPHSAAINVTGSNKVTLKWIDCIYFLYHNLMREEIKHQM